MYYVEDSSNCADALTDDDWNIVEIRYCHDESIWAMDTSFKNRILPEYGINLYEDSPGEGDWTAPPEHAGFGPNAVAVYCEPKCT